MVIVEEAKVQSVPAPVAVPLAARVTVTVCEDTPLSIAVTVEAIDPDSGMPGGLIERVTFTY